MDEIESDILIAEPEEEIYSDENQNDNISLETNDKSTNLFEYKEVPKDENKTMKKETDAFVNYNFNNLNKIYKKYDVVKTYVPKKQPKQKQNKEFEKFVTEQNDYIPETETFVIERNNEKPKFQLKSKAKTWLVSIIIIFAMLSGLTIYNAVHISNLNNQIQETSTSINNINNDIKQVVKNIDVLTDEDNILEKADELGLKEVSPEDQVSLELNPKNEIEEYQSQTNFFDRICNFFRNLFGGK
jgi:cell division protein FtsL